MEENVISEKGRYIYRKWITKNGVRIYASKYGLKAFRFLIK